MHVSTGPSRSVPGYAFPFTKQTERTQKRARLQPVGCFFMLTPDVWDCASRVRHFRAFFWLQVFSCSQALSTLDDQFQVVYSRARPKVQGEPQGVRAAVCDIQ